MRKKLLDSQRLPDGWDKHLQTKWFNLSSQVPPLRQGLLAHSFISKKEKTWFKLNTQAHLSESKAFLSGIDKHAHGIDYQKQVPLAGKQSWQWSLFCDKKVLPGNIRQNTFECRIRNRVIDESVVSSAVSPSVKLLLMPLSHLPLPTNSCYNSHECLTY